MTKESPSTRFFIGCQFQCGNKRWYCTDVGSRVIVGICLDDHYDDPTWYHGPPYAVNEYVFDENDQLGCHIINIYRKKT